MLASLDAVERLPTWRAWMAEQTALRQSWIRARMAAARSDLTACLLSLGQSQQHFGGNHAQPWNPETNHQDTKDTKFDPLRPSCPSCLCG